MTTRPAAGHTARAHAAPLPARTPAFTPARRAVPPRPAGPAAGPADTPGTYARADLPPEPAAAGQARRLTRQALTRWGMDALTDEAQAIASELAANAAAAAIPARPALPAIIFAVHQRPGELRIIVWDNGPGQPQPAHPGTNDEHGRGLAIIDALTRRNWGWWPTPKSGGKVVWAALPTTDDDGRDPSQQSSPC
jgi:anti-sigma regulatory factor (Ser/Thr protein kinase)